MRDIPRIGAFAFTREAIASGASGGVGCGSPASGDGRWMSLLLAEQREGYVEAVQER